MKGFVIEWLCKRMKYGMAFKETKGFCDRMVMQKGEVQSGFRENTEVTEI